MDGNEEKFDRILDIWNTENGVIIATPFSNIPDFEARNREAALEFKFEQIKKLNLCWRQS